MSGPQIHSHANELGRFLTALKDNREVHISNVKHISRILVTLNLEGNEHRPFTDHEISNVMKRYTFFKRYFEAQKLWLDRYDEKK